MSLQSAIATASSGAQVPADVLEAAFGEIVDGKASPVQIAALLIALRTKGESVEEIVAAARALRARAETAVASNPGVVDTCGTGGDGSGTFNVSTAAAFVVAGAGVPVAKHGNRAASSRTGSVDVLEALGVRVDVDVATAAAWLREVGIAPFFARRAHPAMRYVAPIRQELGVRTIMNCLGPLLNPVGAKFQVVGVYSPDLVRPIAEALGALGAESALVVHGDDGLDEITTTTSTRAARLEAGGVRELTLDPQIHGIDRCEPAALMGGDAAENAAIIRKILDGEKGAPRDIAVANAGAALWVAGAADDWGAGIAAAVRSLESGAARERLAALVRVGEQVATS